MTTSPLISAADLHNIMQAPAPDCPVAVLDASFALSSNGLAPDEAWYRGRIGDAGFFDIDVIADQSSMLPHMVPTAHDFATHMQRLGITNAHQVIVYDQTGIAMAACRAWWMFRLFGHDNVRVLDGGLPAWLRDGYPLNTAPPVATRPSDVFHARRRDDLIASLDNVEQAIGRKDCVIIDARPNMRFLGLAPEPRPGMQSGHMPDAHNIPASVMINGATGCLLPSDGLTAILNSLPLSHDSRIITSCGSGVTACVTALALHLTGYDKVAVYDGSWAEWGQESLHKPIFNHSMQE